MHAWCSGPRLRSHIHQLTYDAGSHGAGVPAPAPIPILGWVAHTAGFGRERRLLLTEVSGGRALGPERSCPVTREEGFDRPGIRLGGCHRGQRRRRDACHHEKREKASRPSLFAAIFHHSAPQKIRIADAHRGIIRVLRDPCGMRPNDQLHPHACAAWHSRIWGYAPRDCSEPCLTASPATRKRRTIG